MPVINVLYVEDDIDFRRDARAYFRAPEYKLDVAADYESGVAKARRKFYELIILDGLEWACFELIEAVKDVPHGEIIIFSGHPLIISNAESRGIGTCYKTEGLDGLCKLQKQNIMLIK